MTYNDPRENHPRINYVETAKIAPTGKDRKLSILLANHSKEVVSGASMRALFSAGYADLRVLPLNLNKGLAFKIISAPRQAATAR